MEKKPLGSLHVASEGINVIGLNTLPRYSLESTKIGGGSLVNSRIQNTDLLPI